VHYALLSNLPGANEARQSFIEGKKLYSFFEEITNLSYAECKDLYLAKCYGQRTKATAKKLGVTEDKAREIEAQFDSKAPWLSRIFRDVENIVIKRGFVTTIAGRKRRFDLWVPKQFNKDNPWKPIKTFEAARKVYPDHTLKRFKSYRAFNGLIQGSAADQTKVAMVLLCEAGLMPQLTVHDEINRSVNNEKEALLQKEIMENAIPLKLPVVADLDLGETWQ